MLLTRLLAVLAVLSLVACRADVDEKKSSADVLSASEVNAAEDTASQVIAKYRLVPQSPLELSAQSKAACEAVGVLSSAIADDDLFSGLCTLVENTFIIIESSKKYAKADDREKNLLWTQMQLAVVNSAHGGILTMNWVLSNSHNLAKLKGPAGKLVRFGKVATHKLKPFSNIGFDGAVDVLSAVVTLIDEYYKLGDDSIENLQNYLNAYYAVADPVTEYMCSNAVTPADKAGLCLARFLTWVGKSINDAGGGKDTALMQWVFSPVERAYAGSELARYEQNQALYTRVFHVTWKVRELYDASPKYQHIIRDKFFKRFRYSMSEGFKLAIANYNSNRPQPFNSYLHKYVNFISGKCQYSSETKRNLQFLQLMVQMENAADLKPDGRCGG